MVFNFGFMSFAVWPSFHGHLEATGLLFWANVRENEIHKLRQIMGLRLCIV